MELALVNRAIGVLIDRGNTPIKARSELSPPGRRQ